MTAAIGAIGPVSGSTYIPDLTTVQPVATGANAASTPAQITSDSFTIANHYGFAPIAVIAAAPVIYALAKAQTDVVTPAQPVVRTQPILAHPLGTYADYQA